ncbi:MAG: hypothetical protein CMJ29_13285 [Phycisphaerae bacterium]|nr:hypothetical protein [Phycisphaerae bacterium]
MNSIHKLVLLTCAIMSWWLLQSVGHQLSPRTVGAASPVAMDFARVLDPPTPRCRRIQKDADGQDWLVIELDWPSRWRGGEVDLRGTLFIGHQHLPGGRVLACRPGPHRLAGNPVFTARIPMRSGDGSSHLLRTCELDELVVHFASRP